MAKGEFISIDDIPFEYKNMKLETDDNKKLEKIIDDSISEDSPTTLAEVEKRYIAKVLKLTSGNRSKAAKILGLSRRSLYRKLKRYELL